MAQPVFNQNALPPFLNHAQVMNALIEATLSDALDMLTGLDEALDDEDKAVALLQKQHAQLVKIGATVAQVEKRTQISTAIAETPRAALIGVVTATKETMTASAKLLGLQLDMITGKQVDELQLVNLASEMPALQADLMQKQMALYETLYGFQPGQTLADVKTTGDLTIEDYERANAMISYSSNITELMQRALEQLQYQDTSAAEELIDLIESVGTHLNDLKTSIGNSTALTAAQKKACLQVTSVARDMNTSVQSGLRDAIDGRMEGVMAMLQGLQQSGVALRKATRAYMAELDQYYQAKAAPAAPVKKPKGPDAK